jgi:hypothetical protein
MSDSTGYATSLKDSDPKLRHEFVGMMFAITIGEVGLQAAALAQGGHVPHFLPALSHLILATVVVATSWVGWSGSIAPGARQDVHKVFQWAFLVLLLDVSLVITYFILVRTVEVGKDQASTHIDPASTVAFWILVIFLLYFAWDCLTKIIMYLQKPEGMWTRNYGSRMIPTVVCLVLAWIARSHVEHADLPHYLTADFALLSLVLLFRALKDFVSAWLPRSMPTKQDGTHLKFLARTRLSIFWTALCTLGLILGMLATTYSWPLPMSARIIDEIKAPLEGNSQAGSSCAEIFQR